MFQELLTSQWRHVQSRFAIESGSAFSLVAGLLAVAFVGLLLLPIFSRMLGWIISVAARFALRKKPFALSIGGVVFVPFRISSLSITAEVGLRRSRASSVRLKRTTAGRRGAHWPSARHHACDALSRHAGQCAPHYVRGALH